MDASINTGLGSVKTAAQASAPGGSGITSATSTDGSLIITNPSGPTADFSVRILSAADVTALAALVTLGKFQTGQLAYVVSQRQTFILQAATTGAANALNVVATSDDVTRQWVWVGLLNGAVFTYLSAEINLTTGAPQEFQLAPGVSGYIPQVITSRGLVTAASGTHTTAATGTMGNDAGRGNMSGPTPANLVFGQAVVTGPPFSNTAFGTVSALVTQPLVSGAAVFGKIATNAAGAGLVLKAKFMTTMSLVPG